MLSESVLFVHGKYDFGFDKHLLVLLIFFLKQFLMFLVLALQNCNDK